MRTGKWAKGGKRGEEDKELGNGEEGREEKREE